jgi:hypothetical protein
MRRSKKLNPSFDVARADLGGNRVGWVYRSESPVAVADLPRAASTTGASGVEAPEQETARDWIGTGIGALVLPVTLTVIAMMAPMLWIFAPRTER